jgi:hypothetical protein
MAHLLNNSFATASRPVLNRKSDDGSGVATGSPLDVIVPRSGEQRQQQQAEKRRVEVSWVWGQEC